MTTTHGMGSQQSHHFTIVESHATEHRTDVLGRGLKGSHGGIGQAILGIRFRNGRGFIVIGTSGLKGNGGSSRFFDSNDSDVRVQISIGNLGEFGFDGFEGGTGLVETSVVTVGS